MSNREKIIVALSIAAFIYGVFALLETFEKKQKPSEESMADVTVFVGQVSESVSRDPSGGLNDLLLARARGPWGPSPFYHAGSVNYDMTEDLYYQGFVQSGRRIYALINNMEYRAGEDIIGRALTVRVISPDRVVLITKEKKLRILPIQGDL